MINYYHTNKTLIVLNIRTVIIFGDQVTVITLYIYKFYKLQYLLTTWVFPQAIEGNNDEVFCELSLSLFKPICAR